MAFLKTKKDYPVGGMVFNIEALNVEDARKAYHIIQRYAPHLAGADLTKDMGLMLLAGTANQLSPDDVQRLAVLFLPTTRVDFQDGEGDRPSRVQALKLCQEEVFCTAFERQLEWLDACIDLNFRSTLEKLRGAFQAEPAKAPEASA
jgi:hypothetical protein